VLQRTTLCYIIRLIGTMVKLRVRTENNESYVRFMTGLQE
jgi:hypothetical protein